MTLRSVILGILGAIFIATVGYFNDQVARLNHFVGNHLPIIVFGPLILFALLARTLRLTRGRWGIRPAEVAVVVAITLTACNIPGSGLLRFFSRNVAMPVKFSQEAGWRRMDALGYAPKCLLVNDGEYDGNMLRGFETGWGKEGQYHIPLSKVPWAMWFRPLAWWLPMVALVAVGSICMGLVVHRTWAERERLPYPIARLANAMLEGDGRGGMGAVLRSRLCLLGVALVLGLHVVNGVKVWTEGASIGIPTVFDFSVIGREFPFLQRGRWVTLGHMPLYPTAVAFAFFIAADVSFSLGISPLALSLFTSVLFWSGANVVFSTIHGGYLPWQHAGSYFALTVMVLYLGRRVYWKMLRGALCLGAGKEVRGYEVWACRGLLVCMAAMTAMFCTLGLDWPLAILLMLMIMLGFLVMGRMNAEAGLILSEVAWQPIAVFLGLFGAKALGLHAFAIIGMLCVQFTLNRRECLMPLFINALRVCDTQKLSSGRVSTACGLIFLAAMVAGVGFGLWVDYNYGVLRGEGWATTGAPRKAFDGMAPYYNQMKIENTLKESRRMTPIQRVANMRPRRLCIIWLAAGAGMILVFYALRLRFIWWPLHPIMFVFWGTWAMYEFAWSFLLGWLIKQLLTRFGAPLARVRTFMIGVIAGDLLGGVLWMIAGAVSYALTGETPPRYHVFPGG